MQLYIQKSWQFQVTFFFFIFDIFDDESETLDPNFKKKPNKSLLRRLRFFTWPRHVLACYASLHARPVIYGLPWATARTGLEDIFISMALEAIGISTVESKSKRK